MSSTDFACPICRHPTELSNQIMICGQCHGELVSRGQVALASTGEFAAMTPARASELLGTNPAAQRPRAANPRCSWCGKSGDDAKKLLSNRDVHICDECVSLCAEILTAELGDDWN